MMFLIPLLLIFFLSICGGILFSVILMNMRIIDVPPKYGWLNVLILAKGHLKGKNKSHYVQGSLSNKPSLSISIFEAGSGKSDLVDIAGNLNLTVGYGGYSGHTVVYSGYSVGYGYNVGCRQPEFVTLATHASIIWAYPISGKCSIIVCGDLQRELLAKKESLNRGLSAVGSMPGGLRYEYQA